MSSGQNDQTFLDAFRDPVERYVNSEIPKYGYDFQDVKLLEPVTKRAFDEAKLETSVAFGEDHSSMAPELLLADLKKRSLGYVRAVISQQAKWAEIRERIKMYNALIIVGAGVSWESGVPLASYLKDILDFCKCNSFAELRSDKEKCKFFKIQFKQICDSKSPSASHSTIVQAFPLHVLEIICLNWDNLIERASRAVNRIIPKLNRNSDTVNSVRYLWKFHGDIENVTEENVNGEGGWVFPDEDGFVFESFTKYIASSGLKNSIFTLLIVGYGERDKVVLENIIKLLEHDPPRPTYRVSLNLKHLQQPNVIIGPSDFILQRIIPQ